MSSVDNRVVKMEFDNAKFESGVSRTLTTLGKLKDSLNFSGTAKGFDEITESTEQSRSGFSALEVIAITALSNITTQAINTGTHLIKSLSVDQLTAGWSKYEEKTRAVAQIMSATGKSVDEVSTSLEKLNWFTDETSYNLSDMTSNIGKFTSQGVDLDVAVTAMEGISTWASLSGQGVNEASRAMYNLSQAMGVGAVKLQDWKSIENANMATSEFKQAALDSAVAVGTLTKSVTSSGETIYKTSKGTEVTVANFSSTLQDAWFSSDVLLKTLDNYGGYADRVYDLYNRVTEAGVSSVETTSDLLDQLRDAKNLTDDELKSLGYTEDLIPIFRSLAEETDSIGGKAFKAAQEAKTFSEVLDSVKDAVSTGWLNTYEMIFGNYEEATELWTWLANALYDVFAASAETRNEVLGTWKELGGRDSLINGFKNTWNGFVKVLDTVKEAFRNIFPAKTGDDLFSITQAFEKFSEKLIMSEETTENLRKTLEGVFSVFKVVWTVVQSVVSVFAKLASAIFPVTGNLLSVTGGIGEFVTNVCNAITESKTLNNVIELIGTAFSKLGEGITKASEYIKKFFSAITGGSEAVSILAKLKEILAPIAQVISSVVDQIKMAIQNLKLSDVIAALGTAMGLFLGFKKSSSSLKDGFSGVFDAIKGGFSGVFDAIKEAFDGVGELLDGVKGSLKAYQTELNAKALLEIAAAVGIMAVSFSVLSSVDSEKILPSLTAMGTMLAGLMWSLSSMTKILSSSKLKGLIKAASSLLILSAALLVLASAVKKLSSLSWEELGKGLAGIAGSLAILIAGLKLMEKQEGFVKSAAGMVILAAALNQMVKPIQTLGQMDYKQLLTGLGSVFIILVELAAFLNLADFESFGITKAAGLLVLAEAIKVLTGPVQTFASIDGTGLIKGLAGLAVVLAEVAVFVNTTGDAKKVLITASGLVVLGAAMKIFASAVGDFGSMANDALIKGLASLAVVLLAVVIAMKNMPTKGVITASASMTIVGAAMKVFASAVADFASVSDEGLIKGLASLAAVLLSVVVVFNLLKGTKVVSTAAGILVLSAAMAVMVPVIKSFGNLKLTTIAKGLGTLVGVLVIFGVAAAILQPMSLALYTLAGALLVFGVAAVAVGAGITLLSSGLTALAVGGGAGIEALCDAVLKLGQTIPQLLTDVAKGLVEMLKVIGDNAPVIVQAFVSVVNSIITGLLEVLPNVATLFIELIHTICTVLIASVPELVDAGMKIIGGVLQGIADNIYQVTSAAIQIIVNFVNAISDNFGMVIDSAFNLIINFVEGLASAIDNNHATLFSAVLHLITSIVQAVMDLLPMLVSAGGEMISSLFQGLVETVAALWDSICGIFTGIVDNVKSLFGAGGEEAGDAYAEGIESKEDTISGAAEEAATSAADTITESGELNFSAWQSFTDQGILGMISNSDQFKALSEQFGLDSADALKATDEAMFYSGQGLSDEMIAGFLMNDGSLGNLSQEDATEAVQAILSMSGEATSAGSTLSGSTIEGLESNGTLFSQAGGSNVTDYLTAITSGQGEIEATTSSLSATVSSSLNKNNTDFTNAGSTQTTNLANGIKSGTGTVTNAVGTVTTKAKTALSKNNNEWTTDGQTKVKNVATGMKGQTSMIVTTSAGVSKAGSDEIGSASHKQQYTTAGENMATGFAQGITNRTNTAVNAAIALAQRSIQAAKKASDQHSPSRIMAKLGNNITYGWANGITDKIGYAENAAAKMAQATMDIVQTACGLISDILDNNLDYEPTITPVVDLSDVDAKAQALNSIFSQNQAMAVDMSIKQAKIDTARLNAEALQNQNGVENNYTFNQYNNSPKALSRIDIYRQTKNQFSQLKELANA